jgi:predicted CXXCH cytochrome family protein
MEQACLSCHRSVPKQNPAQDSVTPSLRNEANRLCLGCHGGKDVNHPVQGSHLLEVPDSMPDIQRLKTTEQGVSLPLAGKRITCITCHNPHQRGVLKTSGAASGAGEASFLRLQRGKVLCTHCHQDIRVPDAPDVMSRGNLPGTPKPEATWQHPPYREEKCKACHAIAGPAGGMDEPPARCFSTGCHETALLKNTFVHERSVLGSCSFCHSPHSASYAKLLFTDGNTLCSTCHPLLRGPDGSPLRKSDHARYISYASANRMLSPGNECRFCHSPSHSEDLQALSTAQCGACHIAIRHMASANRHEQYTEKVCSACHLPHGAPHAYLLKNPPETYQPR